MNWRNSGPQVVPKEAVNLQRMIGVRSVQRAEDIHVNAMLRQYIPSAYHLVEAALSAVMDPIGVVHLPRPIDAQADKERMALEEAHQASSSNVPFV